MTINLNINIQTVHIHAAPDEDDPEFLEKLTAVVEGLEQLGKPTEEGTNNADFTKRAGSTRPL